MTVKTSCVYPPIPTRQFDWCAWFDELGEEGPYGWGETEAEAVSDLMCSDEVAYMKDEPESGPEEAPSK